MLPSFYRFKRVAVGISGGVDSAVAALILKKKGFNVFGVFMQNWDIADETGKCSADEDYKDAAEVCQTLNIELHHVKFVKEYWNEVFCNLIEEYEGGYTPNPDILCNKRIKFNHFYKYARDKLNADVLATGHYAKSSFGPFLENYNANKVVRLLRAVDTKKDQTFFLCQIGQDALKRTMFPLGDYLKSDIKQIALENNLVKFAMKKESMGICFIGSRNFQNFISEYIEDKDGDFVDVDTGRLLGRHHGIHQWTLGQRANISGMPGPYFIARKDHEQNIIYVARGTRHLILHSSLLFTSKPHWISMKPSELQDGNILNCSFQFQHTDHLVPCQVCETDKGLMIQLEAPKRAITPGQFAVFTKDNECLGSAKLVSCGVSEFCLNYLTMIDDCRIKKQAI